MEPQIRHPIPRVYHRIFPRARKKREQCCRPWSRYRATSRRTTYLPSYRCAVVQYDARRFLTARGLGDTFGRMRPGSACHLTAVEACTC